MLKIDPYLNFLGYTEEAFLFYKSIFGGEFIALHRFKDTPEGANLSEEDGEKIMHIALPIGNGNILMGTDILVSFGQTLIEGSNFSLSLLSETKEEADKIFYELSAGGEIEMPMQDTTWGSYFGMFKDKFGIQWMMSFESPK